MKKETFNFKAVTYFRILDPKDFEVVRTIYAMTLNNHHIDYTVNERPYSPSAFHENILPEYLQEFDVCLEFLIDQEVEHLASVHFLSMILQGEAGLLYTVLKHVDSFSYKIL